MNDKGYTITYLPHLCPKPENLPAGTRIVCHECGKAWERDLSGWARIEDKRDERIVGD